VYLDDVIIFSNTEEEHIAHVDHILNLLKKAGVSLKFRKSEFFKFSVDYVGYTTRLRKLEETQSGTAAFKHAEYPTTQNELRSYLGSCNIYRRFDNNFALIASPLTDFLCKGMQKT